MNKNIVLYGLPILVLLTIYFPLFYVHYLYLDDSHQLWHNEKGATFNIWLIHGRYLGGLLMEKAFTSINNIRAVIAYRILSVTGWLVAICIYIPCAKQWARYGLFDKRLVLLSSVYIACSLSLGIYNGWGGTCFEVFLCFITGLLSGHLLFAQLKKHGRYFAIPIYLQLLVLVLGLTSLFIYQVGIGAFLLPFFLHFISKKFDKPDRILITGVLVNLFIYVVYYLLFKLMLSAEAEAEGMRANLNFNILSKISFFFSVPTAQAFSFNFLFNLHSIISQAFYIVAIAVWVLYSLIAFRQQPITKKLLYIVIVFLLQMLMYLPVLVTKENYSSYRTMLNLNLAVFFLLTSMILEWIKNERWKNRFILIALFIFIPTGFYNFRFNFLYPVLKEYQVVRNYIETQYRPGTTKIYFLRPPEDLFKEQFHVHYYRDEFGVPSTFKDWVPEPLVKQIIFEITHDKSIAAKTEIIQFTEAEPFNKQVALKEDHTMVIDVPAIFNAK